MKRGMSIERAALLLCEAEERLAQMRAGKCLEYRKGSAGSEFDEGTPRCWLDGPTEELCTNCLAKRNNRENYKAAQRARDAAKARLMRVFRREKARGAE